MPAVSRREWLASLLAYPALSIAAPDLEAWIPLFDGASLDGWTAGENRDSFRVEGGTIVAAGSRSHLFYTANVREASFKNFEFRADVLPHPGANSGIYFHTRFQKQGWPTAGFEVQINNSYTGEGRYRERRKTGSLYGVRNVYKAFARDGEWAQLHIMVRGKQVQVRLNDLLLVDYVEPDPPIRAEKTMERVLNRGTFALQCHDPGSRTHFRNIAVKPLPDDVRASAAAPEVDEVYRQILDLSARNFPVVDYHTHLKGGLTIDEMLRESRRLGIQYGVAVNCGVSFPIHNDAGLNDFLETMKGQPVFIALQAEGREWVNLVSSETVAKFDYVFTDSMTYTDDAGKRMRLWIKEEVGDIRDPQAFMETYVDRTIGILSREPIDIYANPTFLPDVIASQYDVLWTEERMRRVVEAAATNGVAMEINSRYRLPSPAFIQMAKAAGVKFSFGTNNDAKHLGRCEYGLRMVKECGLDWHDFFIPKEDGNKPVQVRGLKG
ncbi:MAG: DUF1080 domain-containing protein [Bryobacteraceae bacterium]|nr:DUF1080 domain-containing protein [Bryobacteraceae bacterium]